MSRDNTTIAALSELYFTGFELNGVKQGLLDDSSAKYGVHPLLQTDDQQDAWVKTPHATGKGDVDGDGLDEIIVVRYMADKEDLDLRRIELGASGKYESSPFTTIDSDFELSGDGRMTVILCDIDGDSRDEIVLADGPSLYIFDDADKKYALLAQKSYENNPGLAYLPPQLQLAAGDLNGDGREQLVVVHSSPTGYVNTYIYDSKLDMSAKGTPFILQGTQSGTVVVVQAFVAVGDLDRDGIDELVLTGTHNRIHYGTFVFDESKAKNELIDMHPHYGQTTYGVQLLDVDHDGKQEIVAGTELLSLDKGKLVASKDRLTFPLPPVHTAGDVDGDKGLREELVLYYNWGLVEVWGRDSAGKFTRLYFMLTTASTSATLVAANVDRDSLVLKYKSHELRFSKPRALAVLAAPPHHAGLGQNLVASGTTFGKTQGSEVETSTSLGFSAGMSIGFSSEVSAFGVKVFEAESMTSFEMAMNWTAATSTSVAYSYAFTGGADEDKVVFTAVPYDVYSYQVISADKADAVGKTITINLPREPQTFSVSRTFYNANNGAAPDIDSALLKHTIGDPSSYPNAKDRDALKGKDGFVSQSTITVGEGSGSQTLTISCDQTDTTNLDVQMSMKSELELTVGGFKAGMSMGTSSGFGYTLSATEGFFVEGKIGDIPSGKYSADKLYRAGLFAYRAAVKGQPLLVVNYWVE